MTADLPVDVFTADTVGFDAAYAELLRATVGTVEIAKDSASATPILFKSDFLPENSDESSRSINWSGAFAMNESFARYAGGKYR